MAISTMFHVAFGGSVRLQLEDVRWVRHFAGLAAHAKIALQSSSGAAGGGSQDLLKMIGFGFGASIWGIYMYNIYYIYIYYIYYIYIIYIYREIYIYTCVCV
jgi:hypothetical protein